MHSGTLNDSRINFRPESVPQAPADSHYGLRAAFRADQSTSKLDLVIGAYRDGGGKPWILPVVRIAEERLFNDSDRDNEYLPIPGLSEFNAAAQKLILGPCSPAITENRVCSFQTISGTGALHLGGLFLSKFLPQAAPTIYLSTPSYDNHTRIFGNVGLRIERYPYYDRKNNSIDFEGMVSVLRDAHQGSIVLLQACAHNPTGLDLNKSQWQEVAQIIRERALFPFFDCAYQGFASGSLSEDSWPVRYFIDQGLEAVIAQSFAKNMGLYGQRVGCLHFVAASGARTVIDNVASQLAILQRSEISTPPIHGAKVASIILNDAQLYEKWEEDLRTMAGRIKDMRAALRRELERLETPGDWSHITDQIGMFSFTGLTAPQAEELRRKWHIYLLPDGRISMAALNDANVEWFAGAVDQVIRGTQQES